MQLYYKICSNSLGFPQSLAIFLAFRILFFWKEEKVPMSEIWRTWWLSGPGNVVLVPVILHKLSRLGRHIVVVELPLTRHM